MHPLPSHRRLPQISEQDVRIVRTLGSGASGGEAGGLGAAEATSAGADSNAAPADLQPGD